MRVIIQIIQSVLLIYLMHSCVTEPLRCGNCSDLQREELLELRYDYFKKDILKKMHLSEAPQTDLPKPPLKSLLVMTQMEEKRMALESNDDPEIESVILHPEKDSRSCLGFSGNESIFCNRFQYNISESLFTSHFLSAEIWIHKPKEETLRVYQIISDNSQHLTNRVELDNIEKDRDGWWKFSVYKYNSHIIVLEVLEETKIKGKDVKPFLVIRSKPTDHVSSRKKRNLNCEEDSSSCCKENFFLNFSEIGWANWILHPEGYQANFCRGRCFNDLSNTRFYHSSVLLSYIRDNKDLAEEIGLNMCCTPSVMSPVTIIYRNEAGMIFHKTIENMKVEACDCA